MTVDPGVVGTRALGLVAGAIALAGLVWYVRSGHFNEDAKYALFDAEEGGEGGEADGEAARPRR